MRWRKKEREAEEAFIRKMGGSCEKCGGPVDLFSHDHHEWDKEPKYKGKGFWKGKWGRKWKRDYGTPREERTLTEIRDRAMLLCTRCHRKVSALERKLKKSFSRKEVLEINLLDKI